MSIAKEVQTKVSRELSRNGEVCTLCQEFTTKAVDYLAEKKVQADILIYLHLACSRLHALKHQVYYFVISGKIVAFLQNLCFLSS